MSEELTTLLREIRDQQRQALERQGEALAMQREQMALYTKQLDRVERINERAEALQGRAGRVLKIVLWLALPVVGVLLAAAAWPLLRGYAAAWLG